MAGPAWDVRPEISEAVGLCVIIVVGGLLGLHGQDLPAIALAWGLAVMVMVYTFGHVGGAHFNPAITLAFAVTGHFPWRRVPSYMAAQLLGAFAGTLLVAWTGSAMATATGGEGGSAGAGLAEGAASLVASPTALLGQGAGGLAWATLLEGVATGVLALVIAGVATDRRAAPGAAGLAIGAAVAAAILAVGPLTGAAINPARALAPALLAPQAGPGAVWFVVMYVAAPAAGAVAAMVGYEALRAGRLAIAPKETLGSAGRFELGRDR